MPPQRRCHLNRKSRPYLILSPHPVVSSLSRVLASQLIPAYLITGTRHTLPDSMDKRLISAKSADRLICPQHRSPSGSYSRGHKPIQHADFVGHEHWRVRYWARSFVGWEYFSRAQPNDAHRALAALEVPHPSLRSPLLSRLPPALCWLMDRRRGGSMVG